MLNKNAVLLTYCENLPIRKCESVADAEPGGVNKLLFTQRTVNTVYQESGLPIRSDLFVGAGLNDDWLWIMKYFDEFQIFRYCKDATGLKRNSSIFR